MTKKRQFCRRGHDTFQFGRDPGHRCLKCRAEDAEALLALAAAEAAESEAERRRRREEADARREAEYQAALKAGGRVAAEARWWRASDETAIAGRYDLCQWEDEIDGEYTHVCFNRTRSDVYCLTHNRQLEREVERDRRQRAKEARS
jgi:hypothetical protein